MTFGFGMGFPRASSAAGGPSLNLQFAGSTTLDPRITFTRASSGSYYNSVGVLTLAGTNIPRLDYNPTTLQPQGLLIEEARTNLLLNSLIDGTNLTTQTVTVTAVATTISFYGTGTVVLSGTATATVVGTGAYPSRQTYTFTPTAGSLTLTVTGTVQFAQLEAGAFATSYIPTAAAAATRAADVASINTLTPWYNATEGTLYTESQSAATVTGNRSIAVISDGTANNRLQIRQDSATVNSNFIVLAGVLNYFQSLTFASGAVNKAVLAYATNNANSAANGIAGITDTSETIPTGLTKLDLGNLASIAFFNGYLRTIAYYPRRLSNAELQSITA